MAKGYDTETTILIGAIGSRAAGLFAGMSK
jgi:hypothetical protein